MQKASFFRFEAFSPQPWQGCALPTELLPHAPLGVPLTAVRTEFDGAGDESRTRDLNLGKVALYQLSYSRTEKINFNENPK